MTKSRYRAVSVKKIDLCRLKESLGNRRCVVGIDVAKEDFFAAVADGEQKVHMIVKWKHPEQSVEFLDLVNALADDTSLSAAMEPSGVYGDAVRARLWAAGVPVFRVSPKRSHDAAEVYDGVSSWHDAKSASIICKLHLDGASELWPVEQEQRRVLTAALRVLEIHHQEVQRNRGRLEAMLARHWPELTQWLQLDSATLLTLLAKYGDPRGVAENASEAREMMRKTGRNLLAQDKIEAVAQSAVTTFGMPQIDEEVRMVRMIAVESQHHRKAAMEEQRHVEKLSVSTSATKLLAPVVGKKTAAVLIAAVGDVTTYQSAAAYEKSIGLNLREKSSGKQQGALHISKRGPGVARAYLYMAALRLLQKDKVILAWYRKKVQRDAGKKSKAVVAIMRKLARALWHVARGSPFDSTRLFDVRRLNIESNHDLAAQ